MENTKAIQFASRVYLLEHEAYASFQVYTDSLRSHFRRYSNSAEKVETIEFEIADFLDIRLSSKEYISVSDVSDLIKHFGYSSSWDAKFEDSAESEDYETKRFYLDRKNKLAGGVCSGLANYFSVEISLVRVLTVIATVIFLPVAFFYLLIWLLAPSLEKAQKMNRFAQERESKYGTNFKAVANGTSLILSKIFGVLFLFIAISLTVAVVSGLLFLINEQPIDILEIQIFPKTIQSFYIISIFVGILFPFLLIFMLGMRLLSNRAMPKFSWLAVIVLWFGSISYIIYHSLSLENAFDFEASFQVKQYLSAENSKHILIKTNFDPSDNRYDMLTPEVNLISSSRVDSVLIKTRYTSTGSSRKKARENAEVIRYEPYLKGNKILIENQFTFEREVAFRLQKVEIDIYVPKGAKVNISNFNRDFFYVENKKYRSSNRYAGRFDRSRSIGYEYFPRFKDELYLTNTENGFEIKSY